MCQIVLAKSHDAKSSRTIKTQHDNLLVYIKCPDHFNARQPPEILAAAIKMNIARCQC